MRYALLYYYDPAQTGPTDGEVEDWLAWEKDAKAAGVHVYEAGFQPHETATTVQVRGDDATTEPGPVIGTSDVIAGFYVIDVSGPDEAVEWAKRIPTASYGKVEVRPIVEFEG